MSDPTSGKGPLTLAEFDCMGVEELVGVGARKLTGLREMGIESLADVLFHYPRRYVDRSREARVADLTEGEQVLVIGAVANTSTRRVRGGRTMVTVDLVDRTGSLRCTFFNQPWRARQLDPASLVGEVAVFGKVELYRGRRQMTNPVVDLVGDRTGRIVPIYPQSAKAGLNSWEIGSWVAQVLRRSSERGVADPLPQWLRDDLGLCSREEALAMIHLPATMKEVARARERLAFDELLRIQVSLVRSKRELEAEALGIAHRIGEDRLDGPSMVEAFIGNLPYALTDAQRRAVPEILTDMAAPVPMHRLLQGDVGSGKTVVAVAALLAAVQGGHQGALMAPTEVLAEQHAAAVAEMISGVGTVAEENLFGEREVALATLTNRTPAAERRRVMAGLADGSIDIVVGTHALIQESVQFDSLGVAVVDEQHRFGVEQRAALRGANRDSTVPDVLVMTATPIPRSAAMTVYGDLDVTVLDELPAGRQPIRTVLAHDDDEVASAWDLVRTEVAAGRRAYVVCPLIEESARVEASAAQDTYTELTSGELADLEVGLLHGRVPPDERRGVMEAFRRGELQVLVATTVIEVGVDVPEATVMVILDADRFGIAQLHQLRGRVGRGGAVSHCVLVARGVLSPDAEERLAAMVRTTDGFELAEVDLELRGSGTVMGERQKGRSDLKLASLRRDRSLLQRAREVAFEIVDGPGGLSRFEVLEEEVDVLIRAEDEVFLTKG